MYLFVSNFYVYILWDVYRILISQVTSFYYQRVICYLTWNILPKGKASEGLRTPRDLIKLMYTDGNKIEKKTSKG